MFIYRPKTFAHRHRTDADLRVAHICRSDCELSGWAIWHSGWIVNDTSQPFPQPARGSGRADIGIEYVWPVILPQRRIVAHSPPEG
jgi:hypothetical protein